MQEAVRSGHIRANALVSAKRRSSPTRHRRHAERDVAAVGVNKCWGVAAAGRVPLHGQGARTSTAHAAHAHPLHTHAYGPLARHTLFIIILILRGITVPYTVRGPGTRAKINNQQSERSKRRPANPAGLVTNFQRMHRYSVCFRFKKTRKKPATELRELSTLGGGVRTRFSGRAEPSRAQARSGSALLRNQ